MASAASAEQQDRKGGRVARAAALLCREPKFLRWLDSKRGVVDGCHDESRARDWLVHACGVSSRADLDHDRRGALMFRKIIITFQQECPPAAPFGDAKRTSLELPKLLAAANGAPCMRCSREDSSVVACHYQGPRSHVYGKGLAIKPDDTFVAYLCRSCHALLDSYQNGDQELARSEEFLHLVAMTMNWLFRNEVVGVVR